MSEYLDHPYFAHPAQISNIDASYGREYDPYPDSRTRSRRQESNGVASPGSYGKRGRTTPTVPQLALPSPIPNVHRLTYQDSARAPVRSPPAPGSFTAGAAMFREHDQMNAAQWTQAPTNVSYPASRGPSMMSPTQQSWRADISFAPRHVSTPAPSPGGRYDGDEESAVLPGGFQEGPSGRYGEHLASPTQHDDRSHPQYSEPAMVPGEYLEEPSGRYREHDRYTAEPESYVEDSGFPPPGASYNAGDETRRTDEDMEEEIISREHSDSNGGSVGGGMGGRRQSHGSFKIHEIHEEPMRAEKKGRRFTDRFMNIFSRKSSKSGSRKTTESIAMPVPHPARPPFPRSQPSRANLAGQSPSRSPNPHTQSPSRLPATQFQSPPRPSNPVLSTTADLSRSTASTTSSQGGPYTPDQSADARAAIPDDANFPNPYEQSGIPQPQLVIPPPEVANLQPTADYDIMSEDPVYDSQPDYTFTSRINTISRFFSELTHLPFKTRETVTVPYHPGDSHRARYAVSKPGKSWYTKEKHERLDLLATPTQIMRSPLATRPREQIPRQTQASAAQRTRAVQVSRSPPATRSPPVTKPKSLDAATAIRPNTTPASLTTHGGLIQLPSSGLSSQGHGLPSGSVQYIYASPQPLYLVPGTALNQQSGQFDAAAATTAIPARMRGSRSRSPQQGVPVYVLTTPGPLTNVQVPGSSSRRHRKHRSSRSPTQRRHEHKSASSTSSPPPPMPAPRLDLLS